MEAEPDEALQCVEFVTFRDFASRFQAIFKFSVVKSTKKHCGGTSRRFMKQRKWKENPSAVNDTRHRTILV